MIELLYTTLVLFGFIFPFFFIFKEFKPLKLGLIFFQWILSVILLSDNFYKDQSLYEDPNFERIQSTDFKPIKSLYKTFYENGSFENISFDTMYTSKFSLIKTQKYPIQCFENYYITANESCPINDIKLGNKNEKIYDRYIPINENEYIYYTKENNFGKLYKPFNYSDFKLNTNYNSFSLDGIIRKEFNKLSNPIYDFKSYIKFCDVLCFLVILFSFFQTIFESLDIQKRDIIRLLYYCSQFIIIILHFIRYIKFIDVKNFLFDNEDIYDIEKEDYFPNKVFNIDSFLLAVSINLFIYNFLCISFPDKASCCEAPKCCETDFDVSKEDDFGIIVAIFMASIYITFFTLSIFDILNDEKILDVYNNMIYNWNMNPIQSIKKTINNDGSESNFLWKNDSFKIERLNNFNYISIFMNKNSKICGKDNYGNNLYFPTDVDCPINEIYFSDKNEYLVGYTKIKLNDGKYLYYTNESIQEKIIVDLRISSNLKIPFNPEYKDHLTNIPFYDEIDSIEGNPYLYSINYLGINTSSISGDKIEKFKHNIKVYKALSKGKLALFCLLNIFIMFFLINLCLENCSKDLFKILLIIIPICILIVYLLNLIFIIICLSIHVKYITNFMNKINLDFQREKNDFKWNLIILIYQILLVVTPLSILLISDCFSDYIKKTNIVKKVEINTNTSNNIKEDKIKELEEKIEVKDKEIIELKEKIQQQESNNEILTINHNISETNRLKNELKESKMELDIANKKLLENLDLINQKEKRIKILEEAIPFDVKEGERLMCVIFQSFTDQSIHYPFLCTNKQIFNSLENKLYEKLPEYRQTNNYFISDGEPINKYHTMEENNIRDGAIICMNVNEFS